MFEDVWVVLYMFSRQTIVIDEKLKIKGKTLNGDVWTVGVAVKIFSRFQVSVFLIEQGYWYKT